MTPPKPLNLPDLVMIAQLSMAVVSNFTNTASRKAVEEYDFPLCLGEFAADQDKLAKRIVVERARMAVLAHELSDAVGQERPEEVFDLATSLTAQIMLLAGLATACGPQGRETA